MKEKVDPASEDPSISPRSVFNVISNTILSDKNTSAGLVKILGFASGSGIHALRSSSNFIGNGTFEMTSFTDFPQ